VFVAVRVKERQLISHCPLESLTSRGRTGGASSSALARNSKAKSQFLTDSGRCLQADPI
jgi:hypothetical protein